MTVGNSPGDIANIVREAALIAVRNKRQVITMKDIDEARERIALGIKRRFKYTEKERWQTAYHEAGHAIVTYQLPHLDPVHRISIVSRGMALGFTLIPPAKDRVHETRTRLINQIASMLGGRAAEDLIFNELTTGASNDIDKATSIARQMVIEFGMSAIGPVNFGPQMDIIPGGKMVYEQPAISPEMLSKIDSEVQKILDTGYKTALATLKKVRAKLDAVAEALIKKETLEGDEFERIMGGPRPAVLPHPANS